MKRIPLVLLAGGKSSRVGVPKGLIEVGGRSWLEDQCECFRRVGGSEIILVLGFEREAYENSGVLERTDVHRVINSEPEYGPFTSVQIGVKKALELGSLAAFILPIDVPVPSREVWEKLALELNGEVRVCQPVFEQDGKEKGGHPVLLSADELHEIVKLPRSSRLDRKIHELPLSAVRRVPVQDGAILSNLNRPEDWEGLARPSDTTKEIGKGAALLSIVEIGLGSLLHGMHIPTAGHWLSLNQSFWLSRTHFALASREDARFATLTLSNVTASLKSLAPAGKKLTPMLAISAQGALYNSGTLVFGRGLLGACIGAVLLSFWAFIQPAAIYYVIFGNTLVEALAKLFEKAHEVIHFTAEEALGVLATLIAIKALLAIGTVFLAAKLPQKEVDRYRDRLLKAASLARPRRLQAAPGGNSWSHAASAAARDLLHPLFLISFALTVVFFFWAESARVGLIWILVRPIAIGFVVFFLLRVLPAERILQGLKKRGFTRFASALRVATAITTRERR